MRDAELHQLPVEARRLLLLLLERGLHLLERGALPPELASASSCTICSRLSAARASTSAAHSRWSWPSASWRAARSCRRCSSAVASAAVLSARAVLSPSAFWSTARPCWSWARAVATSTSHVDAREHTFSRSSRARRRASSHSTNTVRTRTTAEAPSAAWAPCSGGESSRASALYASHLSGDLRASTRASRASYYPRYQRESASRRSRTAYRSRARRSSSSHQQAEREVQASEKTRTREKAG
jgi:hypothetical protein